MSIKLVSTIVMHVCAVSACPVFHDKVIVADGRTVEFGSFNDGSPYLGVQQAAGPSRLGE